MTALLHRRSAYGLEPDRDNRWDIGAPCGAYPDLWSDIPSSRPTPQSGPSRAAHLRNYHCGRFARCLAAALETRPSEIVQAGLLWPRSASRPPRELPETRCGRWCQHLKGS